MAKKVSLNEEFEIKGEWFIPGVDKYVAGILHYRNDSIHLELFNSLEIENEYSFDVLAYDVIFGITETGEKMTLCSVLCFNTSNHYGEFEFNVERYTVSEVFVGGHFLELNNAQFQSLEIEFSYLPEWLGEKLFSIRSEANWYDKKISITKPELIDMKIHSINSKLKGAGTFTSNNDLYRKAEFTSTSTFKIIPDEMKDFDWFRKQMINLQQLMTLLIGRSVYIINSTFFGTELETNSLINMTYKIYPSYKLFFKQRHMEIVERLKEDNIFLPYKDLKINFHDVVNKWFDNIEKLDAVYDLYTGEMFGSPHLTTSFNNLMQSIEAFHRINYKGTIIEDKDFEIYLSEIQEYIIQSAPKALKDKLSDTVIHGNKFSLKKRLVELSQSLSSETNNLIFGDEKKVNKFLQKLVDTRNYLTHYDATRKINIIEEDKRIYAIQRINAFLTLLILKDLGLKEEFIIKKFKSSIKWNYQLERAKMIFEKTNKKG